MVGPGLGLKSPPWCQLALVTGRDPVTSEQMCSRPVLWAEGVWGHVGGSGVCPHWRRGSVESGDTRLSCGMASLTVQHFQSVH